MEQTGKHINTLIVGVGLIGGSFALSLRRCGYTGAVCGVEASEDNGRRAVDSIHKANSIQRIIK